MFAMEVTLSTYNRILLKLSGEALAGEKKTGFDEATCMEVAKQIAKLVDGWTAEQIADKLRGNTCNNRPTSCADQLAIAVRKAYEESKA